VTQNQVLAIPRRALVSPAASGAAAMTERDWLHGFERAWYVRATTRVRKGYTTEAATA
jgi:hypothetical protein